MDPNETLQILRHQVKHFVELYDTVDNIERDADRALVNHDLIDTADTIAEAFDALDNWLKAGGFQPRWTD